MSRYPRVLVVEDDPIVLLTFTLELQGDGLEVLGALSFAEAKGIVLAAAEPFAAAVIELRGGTVHHALALAREVRTLDPATPVIFTAEASRREPPPAGIAADDILAKPPGPRALGDRIRRALAR